jgi:hypothetical protein
MALSIPIVSTFDGAGVSKAVKQFQNLETAGEKAHFAITKAAVPAGLAIAAVTVALGDAVKAALDDFAAQEKLAGQLKRTTGATDDQVKSTEDWITQQGKLLGYSDDQLRPALAKLVRQTHDVQEAQEGVSLAMDIATATGKPLEAVTNALEKAYGGNLGALKKLSPEVGAMIKGGMDLDGTMQVLSETFKGAASDAAETAAGKFARMKLALDETKESIGAALMPAVEKILPVLQAFAQWAQDNPGVFLAIAGAVTAISGAVLAYVAASKIAVAANVILGASFTALDIASGIGIFLAIDAAIITSYARIKWFRDGVNIILNDISGYLELAANNWIMLANVIIRAMNLISPFGDIPTIKHVTLPRIGGTGSGDNAGGNNGTSDLPAFVAPTLPKSVTTPGKVKNAEPPMTPYKSEGDTSGGYATAGLPSIDFSGVTFNIDAGLIASPASVGGDIVDAILAYQRTSGIVFEPAATL